MNNDDNEKERATRVHKTECKGLSQAMSKAFMQRPCVEGLKRKSNAHGVAASTLHRFVVSTFYLYFVLFRITK